MAEPSIIIPKLFTNFQPIPEIKLKHSIPFLCDSAFNAQNLEKAVDVTGCITQTQVPENHWWKNSSGLIRFHCRNPIVSMMIDHNTRVSLFLVDVTDDDEAITTYYLFGSTNFFFIFGGSGRSGASLIPGTIKSPSVRKAADTQPGNDYDSNGNGNSSEDSNDPYGNGNGSNKDSPNGSEKDGRNANRNGGNEGGNGGNDGGRNCGNGGGGYDGINGVPLMLCYFPPLAIYRISVNFDNGGSLIRRPVIYTNIFASQLDSWDRLSGAVNQTWLRVEGNNDSRNLRPFHFPFNCWPGCVTCFGHYEGGIFRHYDWLVCQWGYVKELITAVVVFRLHSGLKGE